MPKVLGVILGLIAQHNLAKLQEHPQLQGTSANKYAEEEDKTSQNWYL